MKKSNQEYKQALTDIEYRIKVSTAVFVAIPPYFYLTLNLMRVAVGRAITPR